MKLKSLCILLAFLSLGFATAPGWVANGTSLNYSSGGNLISFTVIGVSGGQISIAINTTSPKSSRAIKEDASAISGQFWFDQPSLAHSYDGELLNGLTVDGTGRQAFAGDTWDTITLEGMVSGAQATQVYDGKTGLLLKQTVDAPGVPDVVLSGYYIPALLPAQNATPPASGAANSSINSSAVPDDSINSSIAAPQDNSTDNSSIAPDNIQIPDDNTSLIPDASGAAPQPDDQSASSSSSPCCASAFILLLVGFVALKGR
jgi:hypothetical protein